MKIPSNPLADFDIQVLDKKRFNPSREDIEALCHFFGIGQLRHFKKEKGINFSHANIFIFVQTTQGAYALKFYPAHSGKAIVTEYAINRLLTKKNFATPLMYTGNNKIPFLANNGRLATCYSYINGQHLWQGIKQPGMVRQANAAMLSLKNILSGGPITGLKAANLETIFFNLAQASRGLGSYPQIKTIEAALLDACRIYQDQRPLFTRQWMHNNTSLTNLLIYRKNVYTLDLTHIQEDYALSDLSKLIISSLLFKAPLSLVKTIAKDYFLRHKTKAEYSPVLNALVKIGLIKGYIEKIQREKSADLSLYPPARVKAYLAQRSAGKEPMTAFLKKMNADPKLII